MASAFVGTSAIGQCLAQLPLIRYTVGRNPHTAGKSEGVAAEKFRELTEKTADFGFHCKLLA